MNTTRPKGNNKHLTISERIEIEKGLTEGKTFRYIAIKINKDPSTISKEVRKHSNIIEQKNSPTPCKKTFTLKILKIKHVN